MLTTNKLALVMEGAEQILSLRAKISVAKKDIVSVEWKDAFSEWPKMTIRMPGSFLPRWIMAGSYWSDLGWDFVYAKKPRGLNKPILHNVMLITTKKDRYRRIIVQIPKEKFKEIVTWWQE